MEGLNELVTLLEKLEERKIHYRLNKTRPDTVMIEVAVPGQRWEIEFNTYGAAAGYTIEIERFISSGQTSGGEALEELFSQFSD